MEDMNITTSTPRTDTKPRERFCVDCHTTKTPMWRGGPSGPRSLCNACGIKFRKKNKGVLSSGRWGSKKSEKNTNNRREDEVTTLMERGLVSSNDRKRLREEEEAAVLLMHLSCGSVYA